MKTLLVTILIVGLTLPGFSRATEPGQVKQLMITLLTLQIEALQLQLAQLQQDALHADQRKECDRIQTLEHDLMRFDLETQRKIVQLQTNPRGLLLHQFLESMRSYTDSRGTDQEDQVKTIDMLKSMCQ